jgi:DNA polymerase elongation subunit (family B)
LKTKAKVLIYDIETAPHQALVWGKYDQNVAAFTNYGGMLSFAYKWHGNKNIICETVEGQKSDAALVKSLQKLFNEADVIVAHNGDNFDTKRSNLRMLYHSIPPHKRPASVDTLKVAKKHFSFPGNSLSDLSDYLGLGKKAKTQGISTWQECMNGDAKAFKEMAKYNKKDVALLEKVYNKFLPWISNHPAIGKLLNPSEFKRGFCPMCGSKNTRKSGRTLRVMVIVQEWRCNSCERLFTTPLGVTK